MRPGQYLSLALLATVLLLACGADFFAPAGYETQFREHPSEHPSRQFPLGTDELGRDRFSRLLYGTRVSLLLAPAAALLATSIAVLLGSVAGYAGGNIERALLAVTDLFASVPWLFLLFTVRALLPLNVSPYTSVGITFALLGLLGWTSGARVIRAAASTVKTSDYLLQAQALGCKPVRICLMQLIPAVRPVFTAQFWLSVPLFLLAEANLGMLGLGVTEPLPSWGNLLSELQNYALVLESPWILAPALLLMLVLASFQFILTKDSVH